MRLLGLRGRGGGRRLALAPTLAGILLFAVAALTGPEIGAVDAMAHPGPTTGDEVPAGPRGAAVATPPPCIVEIVDFVFHPPQVVVNGGTTSLGLDIANCTQQSQQIRITQSGAEPPGCPVLDPITWRVTIPAGAIYRHFTQMTDPSCTGLAHMLASVTSGTGAVLASRTAYLTVIPATATRVYADDANRHFRLRVGATLGVSLAGPPGFTWTEPASSDTKALARTVGAGGSSASAVFVAKATGKATVSAIDNPNCYPICEIASRLFEIGVTVVAKRPTAVSR